MVACFCNGAAWILFVWIRFVARCLKSVALPELGEAKREQQKALMFNCSCQVHRDIMSTCCISTALVSSQCESCDAKTSGERAGSRKSKQTDGETRMRNVSCQTDGLAAKLLHDLALELNGRPMRSSEPSADALIELQSLRLMLKGSLRPQRSQPDSENLSHSFTVESGKSLGSLLCLQLAACFAASFR